MEDKKYKFETGSLYKYDEETNSYIHVFNQAGCDTKKKAIREYEEQIIHDD